MATVPAGIVDVGIPDLSRTTRIGLGLAALGFAGAFTFPDARLKLASLGVSGVGVAFIADVFRSEEEGRQGDGGGPPRARFVAADNPSVAVSIFP